MEVMVEHERTLIGIESRASNEDPQAIGAIWQRFMADKLADQIPNRADHCLVAAYCDYDGDHTDPYTFFLGCTVTSSESVPDGFTRRVILSGRYLRREAKGTMPEALMAEWGSIWTSGIDRLYKLDFEIHNPDQPGCVDIYIGVA